MRCSKTCRDANGDGHSTAAGRHPSPSRLQRQHAAGLPAGRALPLPLALLSRGGRSAITQVRERLRALASERPRFGYQRLHLLLQREGLRVNHKRVYRLYREERLLVRPHRGRKTPAVPRVPLSPPTQANARWGMDFIHDAAWRGGQVRGRLAYLILYDFPEDIIVPLLPLNRLVNC